MPGTGVTFAAVNGYGVGTAVLRVADNPADLRQQLAGIAGRQGIEVVATDSGWVDDGISLGSSRMVGLRAPRVLLAWDTPSFSMSAGWTRWLLERRFRQPVTAVRVSSLRRVDWKRFDVLVLPSGNYTPQLGEDVLEEIKAWVRDGGTLVTLGEASRSAAREKTALLETRALLRDGSPELAPDKDEKKKEAKKPEPGKPFDLEQAIQPERARPESTPGALLRVTLDTEHWLTAGSDGEVPLRLKDIAERVDILQVFRPSAQVPDVVKEALDRKKARGDIEVIWLQDGIYNEEACKLAEQAGIIFIQDRCMMKEFKRLPRRGIADG